MYDGIPHRTHSLEKMMLPSMQNKFEWKNVLSLLNCFRFDIFTSNYINCVANDKWYKILSFFKGFVVRVQKHTTLIGSYFLYISFYILYVNKTSEANNSVELHSRSRRDHSFYYDWKTSEIGILIQRLASSRIGRTKMYWFHPRRRNPSIVPMCIRIEQVCLTCLCKYTWKKWSHLLSTFSW